MKIDELIEELEAVKQEHGNIPVKGFQGASASIDGEELYFF